MGFVLEGPDGAGKTTLASRLVEALPDYRIEHFGPPIQAPLEEYLHWLVAQDAQGHRMVIDRFHLGESVYGPLFRGTLGLTRYELTAIEWALMVRGYLMIHVTQPLKSLIDSLEQRGDEMVQVNQLSKIVEMYWDVAQLSIMPYDTYDYNWPATLRFVVERETAYRKRSEEYLKHMGQFWGTGCLQPSVILVGERVNRKLNSKGVPFSVGRASEWLIDALTWNGWRSTCYLTNAIKEDGEREMVAREVRWLQGLATIDARHSPQVIALGAVAGDVLTKHKIPHSLAFHPSYHRRFNYDSGPNRYGELLHNSLRVAAGGAV